MRTIKKFIIYFPVILVSLQVCVGLLALGDRPLYDAWAWLIGWLIGTNMGVSVFFVAFAFAFNFCRVSRAAAIAELLFALNWIIVQEDNLYNILFQVIVGCIALWITYDYFIRKFPLCRLSLLHRFFAATILTGSCYKGLEMWERGVRESLVKKMYSNGQHDKYHP